MGMRLEWNNCGGLFISPAVPGACNVSGASQLYRVAGETERMPHAATTAWWHKQGGLIITKCRYLCSFILANL